MARKKPDWMAALDIEAQVQETVEKLREDMQNEAITRAMEALHSWVSRGVEWYHATRGWIFMVDEFGHSLRSIAGATVRSRFPEFILGRQSARESFIGRVFESAKGDFCNDVANSVDHPYYPLEQSTKAELAVPIFDANGPEKGKVIGIYNLESDSPNVFFSALVQELQKNMALLTPHLLVLHTAHHRRDDHHHWAWHPEVHGWSPGRIAERFCHAVVRGATLEWVKHQPSCSIWNVDFDTEGKRNRCWVLGTCGYDYEFVRHLCLGKDSVTGKVARGGTPARDTPLLLDFRYSHKAKYMGVRQAHIEPLQLPDSVPKSMFKGTLNVYTLDPTSVLPSVRAMRWLAQQASRLLGDIFGMRQQLGVAHINSQLASAADPTPRAEVFREALMQILPCDAASLFVARREGDDTKLIAVDSTGIEHPDKKVEWSVKKQDSITTHCFAKPAEAIRINFQSEFDLLGVRMPNKSNPEVVAHGDRDHLRRRRLGVAVKKDGGEQPTGVIRLYRSGTRRPFTQTDAELLQVLASQDRFGRLFENWAVKEEQEHQREGGRQIDPDIPIPPSRSILFELGELFQYLNDKINNILPRDEVVRCSFFVQRNAKYEEFVTYPVRELPDDEEFELGPNDSERGIKLIDAARERLEQAWVKLPAWSGEHVMDTVLVCDFKHPEGVPDFDRRFNEPCRERINQSLAVIASRLTMNEFYPQPNECFQQLTKGLELYAQKMNHGLFSDVAYVEPPVEGLRLIECQDQELVAYGVRFTNNECRIPLRVGTRLKAELVCTLDPGFNSKVTTHPTLAFREIAIQRNLDQAKIWGSLRRAVGIVVGAWTRVVEPKSEEKFS